MDKRRMAFSALVAAILLGNLSMKQIAWADELVNRLQIEYSLPLILKSAATETIIITSSPIPLVTPTETPTPPPATTGLVEIKNIFYDGSGTNEPDEYVEIKNEDVIVIQLENWTLRDEANHVFTFPSFVILPDQVCRIYTNEDHPEFCGFNYGSGSAIWNNSGDCAYLEDASGSPVDDFCY